MYSISGYGFDSLKFQNIFQKYADFFLFYITEIKDETITFS